MNSLLSSFLNIKQVNQSNMMCNWDNDKENKKYGTQFNYKLIDSYTNIVQKSSWLWKRFFLYSDICMFYFAFFFVVIGISPQVKQQLIEWVYWCLDKRRVLMKWSDIVQKLCANRHNQSCTNIHFFALFLLYETKNWYLERYMSYRFIIHMK